MRSTAIRWNFREYRFRFTLHLFPCAKCAHPDRLISRVHSSFLIGQLVAPPLQNLFSTIFGTVLTHIKYFGVRCLIRLASKPNGFEGLPRNGVNSLLPRLPNFPETPASPSSVTNAVTTNTTGLRAAADLELRPQLS